MKGTEMIDFPAIEKKWQKRWEKEKVFEAKDSKSKKKFYVLEMFPYPSGLGLHMGHAFNYSIGDIYARLKRMQGYNVLHPIGFDSFGLPAENAAIKHKSHPKKFTEEAIKNYIIQMKGLGLSYDWSRMIATHKPEYYKWDQWIFLKMLEKGLAYRKKAPVNWCPKCNTVLANEQVVNGKCWRHEDTNVEVKHLEQWFLKITDYADELLQGLDKLDDWPEEIKKLQRNWIGKSEGVEIGFEVPLEDWSNVKIKDNFQFIPKWVEEIISGEKNVTCRIKKKNAEVGDYFNLVNLKTGGIFGVARVDKVEKKKFKDIPINYKGLEKVYSIEERRKRWEKYHNKKISLEDDFYIYHYSLVSKFLKVFTTRPDTIFGVSFLAMSAQHPRLMEFVTEEHKGKVLSFLKKIHSVKEEDLDKMEKEGVFTGSYAAHPLSGEKIPVYVSNFVVADYGSGVVMGVPAHDERDFEFARSYGLELKQVIMPYNEITSGKDAVRKNKKTIERNSVFALVKHWKENKYFLLDWKENKWKSFIIGGIENDETPEEAVIREVKEETGYQDIKRIVPVKFDTKSKFFAAHKDINRIARYVPFLVELASDKHVPPSSEHTENHTGSWIDYEDVRDYLNLENNIRVWDYFLSGGKAYTGPGILVNSDGFDGLFSEEAKEHVAIALREKGLGGKVIKYRLKDWLISRQRFWGTPIPVIYCDDCGVVAVREKELPVKLPENIKFEGVENPLKKNERFLKVKCPKCGKMGKRETDTMDTFANSSWYFLRYLDSENKNKIFESKKANHWMPVDVYIGGKEHACLHLIYFRFYTKFLRDLGLLEVDEPALKLFNQGMLHASDGRKMSKSYGNVVLPESVSKKYGLDAARMFLMSVASPDKDINWSDEGAEGSLRFVLRVIDFVNEFSKLSSQKSKRNNKISNLSKLQESKLNRIIRDYTGDLESFRYNLAVIKIRELFGYLEKGCDKKSLEVFLKLLSPVCPHISEELWYKLGNKKLISIEKWPSFDEKKIDDKLEEQEKNVEKSVEDIKNILGILKEKQDKEGEKVYLYVLPNEINFYDSIELSEKLGKEVFVYAVNDKKKYDPEGKAGKARPGKPGIYVE